MDFDVLTPDEEQFLALYSPYARFEIPSDEEDWHYLEFLEHLLTEMLTQADSKNRYVRAFEGTESGREGGVGGVYIKGKYFVGCKLYWYDGVNHTPTTWSKGMLLRNHEDMGSYTVRDIFFLADTLAEFLMVKKIPFRLLVRKRSDLQDICRAQFP